MNNRYIVQLDGLRFFAVLMVMIAHWAQWSWTNPILKHTPFVHGVTLFFVLSGFLISRILLQNRDISTYNNYSKISILKNFYIRRFFRIFPIYYMLLFFLFIINYENTREIFIWLMTYTSNIYQSINNTYVGSFNHFWSLAVEEQFYLFWPFVLLFIKPKKTFLVIVIAILLSFVTRAYLYYFVGNWMATAYFTLSCMYSLGLGALLAYIKLYNKNLEIKLSSHKWLITSLFVYVFLLILQINFNLQWYKEIFDEFFFSLFAFFLILKASNNSFTGIIKYILENKFISFAGKISYGLYVYHLFMPTLLPYLLNILHIEIHNKPLYFVLLFLLTFCISYLSWICIEKPINKLKNRFPYIKTPTERSL